MKYNRAVFYGDRFGPELPLGVLRNGEIRWLRATFNTDGSLSHSTMDINSLWREWPPSKRRACTFPLGMYLPGGAPTHRHEIPIWTNEQLNDET